MSTAVADVSALLQGISPGAWVAFSEKQNIVLAFGADAQTVLQEAHTKGEKQPLILRVPEQQAAMFL